MAQPDVESLNSSLGVVVFEDGAIGRITNWITPDGESHEVYAADAIALVAQHPGPIAKPWYAIGLDGFDPVVIS